MRFYQLSHNLEDGKKYPQVDCLHPFTASQISPWKELLCNPELTFELKRGAVMTDLITTTVGPCSDMLISSNLYECVKSFNILTHSVFPAQIQTGHNIEIYNYIHLYGLPFTDLIDYGKSSFVRTEWTIPQDTIHLESFNHYQQLKLQDKNGAFGGSFDTLTLSDKCEVLDLFFPFPFDSTIFISERLAEKLIKYNFTGLSINPTDKIVYV